MPVRRSEEHLQASLADITRLLQKHRVLDTWIHRQEGTRQDLVEQLQHRQNLAELHNKLRTLHPADVAYILETLPPDERELVWQQIDLPQRGRAFVEVSDAVRESLVESLDRSSLVATLETLDADDLASVADSIPADILSEVSRDLDAGDRSWLQTTTAYPETTVGHLMTQDAVDVRDTDTVGSVLAKLRERHELPPNTDRLFVIDQRNILKGAVRLEHLLLNPEATPITRLMDPAPLAFEPDEDAEQTAKAFERYDLLSAPVWDDRGKLLGRLTVDVVLDVVREASERRALSRAGLRGEEDLFATIWDSARNRWPWLCLNLLTALIASRVIGAFEASIEQLAALATLMPIVASIGGNTGNQTVALVIRGLALDRIGVSSAWQLLRKELVVSLLNGLVWGSVMGLFAYGIYRSIPLGLVMLAAMALNLIVAAVVGVMVPLALDAVGRDPAQGSSVLLTFMTDSMGFFLFLGLASLVLTG